MFIIQCPVCDQQHLVTNRHIKSIHRTSEGMVGYVRCAAGHTVLHKFEEAYPKPKPPASVIAMREAAANEASASPELEEPAYAKAGVAAGATSKTQTSWLGAAFAAISAAERRSVRNRVAEALCRRGRLCIAS